MRATQTTNVARETATILRAPARVPRGRHIHPSDAGYEALADVVWDASGCA